MVIGGLENYQKKNAIDREKYRESHSSLHRFIDCLDIKEQK